MDLQPDIANLLAKSGATVRKSGDRWIVSNGAKACHGETPEKAAEAFLVARQPRQREVIDRLTVIDTVVVTHEPAPKPTPDMRDVELAAARAEIAFLKKCVETLQEPASLLPAPDALLSDYGPVGMDDITGDLLLDAFEENEAETAAIVQTLSALRLKHLSEQLNVERARLDREHQATGVANPRSASIDRLLGLLTRRGEV